MIIQPKLFNVIQLVFIQQINGLHLQLHVVPGEDCKYNHRNTLLFLVNVPFTTNLSSFRFEVETTAMADNFPRLVKESTHATAMADNFPQEVKESTHANNKFISSGANLVKQVGYDKLS